MLGANAPSISNDWYEALARLPGGELGPDDALALVYPRIREGAVSGS